MLTWGILTAPVGNAYIWWAKGFGYIELTQGEYVVREYTEPISEPSTVHGRYATLEAAKAAAELIYSTRSQP